MICSRDDYQYYLRADRCALGLDNTWKNRWFNDRWRFQRLLRRVEFYRNCGRPRWQQLWAEWRMRCLGRLLGYSIPPNVFGPGLALPHRGTIVVNAFARVGANCRLHVCTSIGTQAGTLDQVPVIGDNCYIGPGAKLFGRIVIGDNTVIGANAVVNHSFPDGGYTLGGIPARVISGRDSDGLLIRGTDDASC
ncbi:serine O-acetyltransferase [Paludibacterium purpuratum]|uniref:Serine O-acetyltransferase n=1 Tax=Paludibacterium purpuratum TaxID=1144873 RepID=A0A4R7B287_9NEIS|nr:serine acetyltransferase [Paludibacterium purpuratum]TDR77816.1 serine O-acetyltransferase [Paludibacterium purpuratum]